MTTHGSRSSYTSGCRCDACREANRAYQTAWRHRTGRSDPAKLQPKGHGRGGYRRGCRCDVCRAANRDAKTRQRRRQGVAAVPQRARMRAARWPVYYGKEAAS